MRLTPTLLWLPLLLLLRGVVAYGGVELAHEGSLRDQYEARAAAIAPQAEQRLASDEPDDVARWAVDARNGLKAEIRDAGNPITKKLAEDRNKAVYGDSLGPSYERLAGELREEGLRPEAVDAAIIAGASRTNAGVNAWANALQATGAGLLAGYALAVALAVWRAAGARLQLLAQEAAILAAGLGGASAGVGLLAPIELVAETSLDTVALGLAGVLCALPLAWAARRIVLAVMTGSSRPAISPQ